MSITIEQLAPETQQALTNEAQRRGVEVSKVAVEVLGKWAQRKRLTGYAKFANVPGSVDAFLREKHAEADAEMTGSKSK